MHRKIAQLLTDLYGHDVGKDTAKKLQVIFDEYKERTPKRRKIVLWDEKDLALIVYPDGFYQKRTKSLPILYKFLSKYVKNHLEMIHILPFYPYSHDRGFSITNYYRVNEKFGDWRDISIIGKKYRLMVDLVSNHVSKQHKWFQKFLSGDTYYEDFFIWFTKDNLPTEEQIKMVRRGRSTPLLNPFKTKKGTRYLWTTYSIGSLIDQIDLNYHNPDVLLSMVKVCLFYIEMYVDMLRLDGVGGLWKELGTNCKHLPQNHKIVSFFREVEKEVRPGTLLFTETTTATFEEAISYKSGAEAHVVYNFVTAPLVLLSFYTSNASRLSDFAKELQKNKAKDNTFFNVLDIHDGINMFAASEKMDKKDMETVLINVEKRGGVFSYRNTPDGGKAVKEMHITWWSALAEGVKDDFEMHLKRFITSRAIAMSLKGIPAIYYLSLFGAQNDVSAYQKTKLGRNMNRTNFDYNWISKKLNDNKSREHQIFTALMKLVDERKSLKGFHPDAEQKVLDLDNRIFAVLRGEGKNLVLALHNVSGDSVEISYGDRKYLLNPYSYIWKNIATNQ